MNRTLPDLNGSGHEQSRFLSVEPYGVTPIQSGMKQV